MIKDLLWFPKYLFIESIYKTLPLIELTNDHNARYYICENDESVRVFYDGYRYYLVRQQNLHFPTEAYEGNPFHFLKDNNYGKDPIVKTLYENAYQDILLDFPGSVNYSIDFEEKGFHHTETFHKESSAFARWQSDNKLDYFPKYIDIGNSNIWVLSKLIDDKSAFYWKCSGEYGMVLNYSDKKYRILKQNHKYIEEAPEINIKKSSASEFIEHNSMFLLDSTKKFYEEAWESIKAENPLAERIEFTEDRNGQYVRCIYKTLNNWL